MYPDGVQIRELDAACGSIVGTVVVEYGNAVGIADG